MPTSNMTIKEIRDVYGYTHAIDAATVNEHTVKSDVPENAIFSDSSVDSEGNHYSPSSDDNSKLSAYASSTTPATWGNTDVITGIHVSRDNKGHVTNISVDSIQLPDNPDSHFTNKLTVQANNVDVLSFDQTKDKVLNIVGDGATYVSKNINGDIVISSSNTTYDKATSSSLGIVKVAGSNSNSVASTPGTTSDRYYGVGIDANEKLYVNVPWTDNNTVYTHPTGDGNLHVPATGTTNNGKVLTAGSTAGSLSWTSITASGIGAAATNHNQASNTITLMSGYSKPSSTSSITTTDTLNSAIGKLEKALDGKQASGSYSSSTHTHSTSISKSTSTNQITLNHGEKYSLTAGGSSYVFTMPSDNNTDTKVTSVDNHYTPSANSSSALSVDASSSTSATWGSTSLVTGVNIQRDAKGHVTGVTVDSIKMPANPNTDTDTKVTSVDNHYTPSANSGSTLSVDASSTTPATWGTTSLVTGVNLQRDAKGHVTGVTVDSIKMPANPNTDNDTKNTAGSTNTDSKIYLVGATSQAANPQTYSHDTVYVGSDGCLYSNNKKVLTDHQDISTKADSTNILAGTIGTSSTTSGNTINIPYVNVNAQGVITGYGTHQHTITPFSGDYNDLTNKPTFPSSLKNPYALSWTGYSSGTYDGSSEKSIEIPSETLNTIYETNYLNSYTISSLYENTYQVAHISSSNVTLNMGTCTYGYQHYFLFMAEVDTVVALGSTNYGFCTDRTFSIPANKAVEVSLFWINTTEYGAPGPVITISSPLRSNHN